MIIKKLFLSFIALCGTLSVSAQADIFDNPANKAYFGARLGLDVSSVSDNRYDSYSNGAGFSIGAIYQIPLYKNLYFEPGLSLFYDTFGQERQSADSNGLPYQIDGSIRNFGFRIPLVAGYHFDFTDDIRIAPFTGPQLNASVSATEHWDSREPRNGSIFGHHGFKHFDLQWVFGVGVTYQRYFASVSGSVGMTKCYSSNADSFKRNIFNVSIGYNF